MALPTFSQFIEAENMQLSGYNVESVSAASGGKSVKTSDVGTAQAAFSGPAGNYFLTLGTFDENDGQATLELWINGTKVEEMLLDRQTDSSGATESNKTLYIRGPFTLAEGDVIMVRGIRNADEVARLDFLRLTPEEAPAGDKLIEGDNSDNNLIGDTGNDTILGYDGNDTLSGETGDDEVHGGYGNDRLEGGPGIDLLDGDQGDDYISDTDGHSTIFGGNGNDTIVMEGEGNYLEAGAGNDQLIINYGNNAIVHMGDGADTVNGSDEHIGTAIYGEEGNDLLNGASGNDTIDGGAGNDIIYAYDDLEDNLNDPQAGGRDSLSGGSGDDFLFGQVGRDTLRGGDNADWLDGGEGSDVLQGGNDNDTLLGGFHQDTLTGGSGADTFRYEFLSDSQKNYTTGDIQVDLISDFTPGTDKIDVSALGFTGLGDGTGTTLVISYSSGSNRTYIKNREADGDGYRFELSLQGNKALTQGDFIFGNGSQHVIIGTNNADSIEGSFESEIIYGLDGNDTLRGGNKLSGQVEGNADTIYGGGGDDDIFIVDGHIVYGEDGNDKIESEFGPATLDGGNGNDTIYGSKGPDLLLGGAGNDFIVGTLDLEDSSPDTINGGAGRDTLTGSAGADHFVFSALRHSAKNYHTGDAQVDGITTRGFTVGLDKIDVSALGFTDLGDGHDHTLLVSYSAGTDRTYVKSLVEDSSGYRFEFFLQGNLTETLTEHDFIFA